MAGVVWYSALRGGGYSVTHFSEVINAFWNTFPVSRRLLPLAWDTVRRWRLREPGDVRRAVPHGLALAMASTAAPWGWDEMVVFILLGFAGMMRPGELASLRRRHVVLPSDQVGFAPILSQHSSSRW